MNFRFDFGEKLDFSRFKRQAPHYISLAKPLDYHFYLPHYKMSAEIRSSENNSGHVVLIRFWEIFKDKDGEIIDQRMIYPLNDTRFQEIGDIKSLFGPNKHEAEFESFNSVNTVERICFLIKILSKINNLKVFI